MRAPIHSRKHIVQISQGTVGQGLVVTTNLVNAIEGAGTSPDHVAEGSLVKACYVEFWVGMDSSTVTGSYTVCLYKDPGSAQSMSTTEMAAIYDYTNKKNILFTAQGF